MGVSGILLDLLVDGGGFLGLELRRRPEVPASTTAEAKSRSACRQSAKGFHGSSVLPYGGNEAHLIRPWPQALSTTAADFL